MKNHNKWLIWSIEHEMWWSGEEEGYTNFRVDAGIYTFDQARKIVAGANKDLEFNPKEAMIEYEQMFDPEIEESDDHDLRTAHKG